MGHDLKVRGGKWTASYTDSAGNTSSRTFDGQADAVKAIQHHRRTGEWPKSDAPPPATDDPCPTGPLTRAQMDAHLAGHGAAGDHAHTPEGLAQIAAYERWKVREGNRQMLADMQRDDDTARQAQRERDQRLAASRPIVQSYRDPAVQAGRGYAFIEAAVPSGAPARFDRFTILFREQWHRDRGAMEWNQWGGQWTTPPTKTTIRLDLKRRWDIIVRATGPDGTIDSAPLAVAFGEKEAAEERARKAKADREAAERAAEQERRRKAAEKQQRERRERNRRVREEQQRRTAAAEEAAAIERERIERGIKAALERHARAQPLIAGSKPVLRLVSMSPRGLAVLEFGEPPDSKRGCDRWYFLRRFPGQTDWTMVGRRHRWNACWFRSDLPARRRIWVRSPMEIAIRASSKYGSVDSDVLLVEPKGA